MSGRSERGPANDHNYCLVALFLLIRALYSFYKPPAGGAGGSEQSDRTSRAKAKGVNGQARAGGGRGEILFV